MVLKTTLSLILGVLVLTSVALGISVSHWWLVPAVLVGGVLVLAPLIQAQRQESLPAP